MTLLLRAFSFLFLVPLTLFFLAVGGFAVSQGYFNMSLEMLPWSGASLTWWVFGISLVGAISIVFAMVKRFRLLYALFALTVLGLALNGVFRSSYRFDDASGFYWALAFCFAALIAAFGAVVHARK